MTNFDIPNESELNPYKVYDYDLVDSSYPIEDNQSHGVYDQFLWLRDTLVKSWKKYSWKAGSKLVIWETEDTVEVIWNNNFRMNAEPWYSTDFSKFSYDVTWPYVDWDSETALVREYPLICKIKQSWVYKIIHKEQFIDIPDTVTQVHSYVKHYHKNDDWTTSVSSVAVFRWECNKTVTGNTYWTDPNWTCRIQLTMWRIFNKITGLWYIRRILYKDDILERRLEDQNWNEIPLQPSSNFMSVELTDLIVKKR